MEMDTNLAGLAQIIAYRTAAPDWLLNEDHYYTRAYQPWPLVGSVRRLASLVRTLVARQAVQTPAHGVARAA